MSPLLQPDIASRTVAGMTEYIQQWIEVMDENIRQALQTIIIRAQAIIVFVEGTLETELDQKIENKQLVLNESTPFKRQIYGINNIC